MVLGGTRVCIPLAPSVEPGKVPFTAAADAASVVIVRIKNDCTYHIASHQDASVNVPG